MSWTSLVSFFKSGNKSLVRRKSCFRKPTFDCKFSFVRHIIVCLHRRFIVFIAASKLKSSKPIHVIFHVQFETRFLLPWNFIEKGQKLRLLDHHPEFALGNKSCLIEFLEFKSGAWEERARISLYTWFDVTNLIWDQVGSSSSFPPYSVSFSALIFQGVKLALRKITSNKTIWHDCYYSFAPISKIIYCWFFWNWILLQFFEALFCIAVKKNGSKIKIVLISRNALKWLLLLRAIHNQFARKAAIFSDCC